MEIKRRFTRAIERLAVRLTYDDGEHRFEAWVHTRDVSLSGVFLSTEFYLRPGMELDLEFKMPNDDRVVRTRGVIVREVRLENESTVSPRTVSGFAIKFTEYFADAKTVLAGSFLVVELDDFIDDYIARRTRKPETERDLLQEVIVAWEVGKMNLEQNEVDLLRETIRVDSDGRIRRREEAQGLRSPTRPGMSPPPPSRASNTSLRSPRKAAGFGSRSKSTEATKTAQRKAMTAKETKVAPRAKAAAKKAGQRKSATNKRAKRSRKGR